MRRKAEQPKTPGEVVGWWGAGYHLGFLGGGRGGFLADGQLSHDSLRPHFSVEAATSLS